MGRAGHAHSSGKGSSIASCQPWRWSVGALGWERTTIRQYRQHIDLHTAPEIGSLKVATQTEARLENFRDHLLAKLSRPMARKVLVSTKSILRTVETLSDCGQGVEERLILFS